MTVYGSGPGAPHDPHLDVGAYVLGVLDYDDMARFEQHLALCPECGRQLDELSGLVPVLAELAPPGAGVPAPPGGDRILGKLVKDVSVDRKRRKTRRMFAIAASIALIIAGPTVAVLATQNDQAETLPFAAAATHSGSDTTTGVKATVGTTEKKWGTSVTLSLSGVEGPIRTCKLVAVDSRGNEQTVSTWTVPAAGYGTADQPDPLQLTGGAGLMPSQISQFKVMADHGKQLVSVKM
jgi:Putative zinc-finger